MARPATTFERYWNEFLPPPLNKITLKTSAPIESELLGTLDFYSEIKVAGKALLAKHGHTELAGAHNRFQAYVRQAKSFYEGAQALHHRASPLNYYYSFMNIAKALICLKDPKFSDGRLTHGISHKSTGKTLKKQNLIIHPDGVFPLFYKLSLGHQLTHNCTLRITQLLGYVSDVMYEYTQLGYGGICNFPAQCAIIQSSQANKSLLLLAVYYAKRPEFKKVQSLIEKYFDHVDLSDSAMKQVFDLAGETRGILSFFESKATYPANQVGQTLSATLSFLHPHFSRRPFTGRPIIDINKPVRTPRLAPMNEMIAIYCFMFFLGSLVRYRPDILESMLTTKDAWIIERFVKAAPVSFLRYAINLFDDRFLVLEPR